MLWNVSHNEGRRIKVPLSSYYLYLANPNEIEVKDISDVKKSTSHLDVNRETENKTLRQK